MEISNSLVTAGTASNALSTAALNALPDRLDDQQLALVSELAASALPALLPCEDDHFAKCFRALAILPRQASDDTKGELQVRLYQRKLGHLPREQISHLIDQALERCRWFPTIAECLEIAAEWARNDDTVRAQAKAQFLARKEHSARQDEVRRALRAGQMDQFGVDALTPRQRRIFEAETLVRFCQDCGSAFPARSHQEILDDETLASIAARFGGFPAATQEGASHGN